MNKIRKPQKKKNAYIVIMFTTDINFKQKNLFSGSILANNIKLK